MADDIGELYREPDLLVAGGDVRAAGFERDPVWPHRARAVGKLGRRSATTVSAVCRADSPCSL